MNEALSQIPHWVKHNQEGQTESRTTWRMVMSARSYYTKTKTQPYRQRFDSCQLPATPTSCHLSSKTVVLKN
ncbi:hypothetical protein HanXRQr2_Chr03g0137621 [Helianthus annuus]|uniref:Uncharacterized protein n=1 Tax=Helianthus annuus TaxID=4232 RepID=A0A9K3NXZ6_HELAN|nr:hypothetical protein HanXRQr2_Chr03g0137621 [Helianthus annuus]KAJ0945990.1 hypothetical protein HanPSC8_Chr03g0134231 [Helianthus annuus]